MKKIFGFVIVLAAVSLLCAATVFAQQPPPDQPGEQPPGQMQPRMQHPPMGPMDPLGEAMFPPEMIMQHTRELNLTDAQKQFMRAEIQKTTTRFNELQWQLQDAVEALHETMKANPVNEQLALGQLDKVLDAEREIKRLHIGMGIRIKNQLTAEQQAKLMGMQQQMMGPDGRGPGPGGPRRGPGGMGGPNGPGPRPGGQPRPGGPGGPGGPPR
jgi:Spy/CpxP family protein refolding chaperone